MFYRSSKTSTTLLSYSQKINLILIKISYKFEEKQNIQFQGEEFIHCCLLQWSETKVDLPGSGSILQD